MKTRVLMMVTTMTFKNSMMISIKKILMKKKVKKKMVPAKFMFEEVFSTADEFETTKLMLLEENDKLPSSRILLIWNGSTKDNAVPLAVMA